MESDTERLFPGKVKGWGPAVSLRASVNVGFTLNTFPYIKNLTDYKTFTPLQTDKMNSSNQNAVNYPLSNIISCKHLKITIKTTSNGNSWFAIGKFDLFGTAHLKKNLNKCTINIVRIRHQVIGQILITMMPSSMA